MSDWNPEKYFRFPNEATPAPSVSDRSLPERHNREEQYFPPPSPFSASSLLPLISFFPPFPDPCRSSVIFFLSFQLFSGEIRCLYLFIVFELTQNTPIVHTSKYDPPVFLKSLYQFVDVLIKIKHQENAVWLLWSAELSFTGSTEKFGNRYQDHFFI